MRSLFSTLCLALAVTIALAVGIRATATPPESVTFALAEEFNSPTTTTGTFVATGAVVATGTTSMVININGMSVHCVDTLTSDAGTIVVHLDCNMHSMNGVWRVVSGTGAYADLKANGTLVMDLTHLPTFTESLIGQAH